MINAVQTNQISFKADLKRLYDKGLLPQVKKGFYGVKLSIKNVTREHLLPKCKGGTRDERNIVLADAFLNNLRGTQPIKEAADRTKAVEYLEQFKDIHLPGFNGKKYIAGIVRTLKGLGLDLTEQVKHLDIKI